MVIIANAKNAETKKVDTMLRKLVSIRRVHSIEPIEGADFIERLVIEGWNVISKKGEFQKGDLAVYFEIDSFIPDEPRYEFLKDKKTLNGVEGYRLRTKKLRGVISQGLALPLSLFPEIKNPIEHDEVTDLLGVVKYEKIIPSNKGDKQPKVSNWPWFIPKTDQERIQNLMEYFDNYKEMSFEETLKLDGSSMTVYKMSKDLNWFQKKLNSLVVFLGMPYLKFKDYHFGVCSRNIELIEDTQFKKVFINNGIESEFDSMNYWKVAYKYNLEFFVPAGFAVQGEMIGPKIQSNHEKVQELEFYVFDVFDIKYNRYLTPEERKDFMDWYMPYVSHVPIVLGNVKIFEQCPTLDHLMKRVTGESMNPGTVSEGRVYKSVDGKVTFKCVSNEYLLKFEE